MATESKLSWSWDGGETGGVADDLVQPPKLVRNRNTRLSVKRGAPAKSPGIATAGGGILATRCTAILPHPSSGNTFAALDTHVRFGGTDLGDLPRAEGGLPYPSLARSLEIRHAGTTMPGRSNGTPSVCVDASGRMWIAQAKQREISAFGTGTASGSVGVYVSMLGSDRKARVISKHVRDLDTSSITGLVALAHWVSVTAHGDVVVLWYSAVGGNVYALTLEPDGADFIASAPVLMQTLTAGASAGCYSPAVVGGDATYGWLLVRTGSTTLGVHRVNVGTMGIEATRTVYTGTLANLYLGLSLARYSYDGTHLINASFTLPSTHQTHVMAATGSMVVQTSRVNSIVTAYDADCCAFFCAASDGSLCWGRASSNVEDALPSTDTEVNYPVTVVRAQRVVSPSGLDYRHEIPHTRLASNGAAMRLRSDGYDSDAVLALTPWYGPSTDPKASSYVLDPCVYMVAVKPVDNASTARLFDVGVLARIGVDRVLPSVSGHAAAGFAVYGHAMQWASGAFAFAYLERSESSNLFAEAGFVGRVVEFSTETWAPPVAQVGSAFALAGGSMPMTWDGAEYSELMPMQAPVITRGPLSSGGVSGYRSYIAVVSWKDSSGRVHRSAPSRPVSFTLSSQGNPDLYVTRTLTSHEGVHADAVCRIYGATEEGGVYRLTDVAQAARTANGCYFFQGGWFNGFTPASAGPALYSDGSATSELVPEYPPPLYDVALAQDRVFGIDAESRSDVVYTKPSQAGVSVEFNAALRLTFPAQAGQLVALVELGGQLIALGDQGVAALYGDGPDSSGVGGFGAPRILSELGCAQRASVAPIPGGVVYLSSDGRWARIGGQGAGLFPDAPVPTLPVTCHARFASGSEVAFFFGDGSAHVYNYALDRWSTWVYGEGVTVDGKTAAMLDAQNETSDLVWVAFRFPFVGYVRIIPAVMDGLSSSAEQASWWSGWILPAGDQHTDCNMRELVVHGLSEGTHGVVIEVRSDFADAATTYTWTSSEVAALRVGTRLTLAVDLRNQVARSVSVRMRETGATGTAWRPMSSTLYFGVVNPAARRAIRAGARK